MIKVTCWCCGKSVKGGDDWAGLSGNCPNCKSEIFFPAPDFVAAAVEPAPLTDATPTPSFDALDELIGGEVEERRDCPFCGEKILRRAVKCRFCHEFLDGANIKPRVAGPPSTPVQQSSPGVAMVLSFIIPGLGQIYRGELAVGLAWMFFTILGYLFMIIPGLIIHIACVANAGQKY